MGDRVGSDSHHLTPSYPTESYIPFVDEADTNSDSSYEEVQTRGDEISTVLQSIDERKKRMSDLREKFYSDYEVQFPADGPENMDVDAEACVGTPIVGSVYANDYPQPEIFVPDEIRRAVQQTDFAATKPNNKARLSTQMVDEVNQPEMVPPDEEYTDSSSEADSDSDSSSSDDDEVEDQSESMSTDDVLSNNVYVTDAIDCVNKPPQVSISEMQPNEEPVQETDLDDEFDPTEESAQETNLDDFPRSPEPESPETYLDDYPRSPVEEYLHSPSPPAKPEAVQETDLDDIILGNEVVYVPVTDDVIQRPKTLPSPRAQSDGETDSESDSDFTSSSSDAYSESSESESESESECEPSKTTGDHCSSYKEGNNSTGAEPAALDEAQSDLQTPTLDTLPPFVPDEQLPEEERFIPAKQPNSNSDDADSERSSFISTDSDDSDEERETNLYSRDLDDDIETLQISSIEDLMKYSKDHINRNKPQQRERPMVQLRSNQDRQPPPTKHRQLPASLPTITERNSECSESESSLSRSSSINSSFGKGDSKVKRRSSKKDEGHKGLDRASEPIEEDKVLEPNVTYSTQPQAATPSSIRTAELLLAPDNLASTEDYRPQTKPVARYSFASPRPFVAKPMEGISDPLHNTISKPRPPPPPVPKLAPRNIPQSTTPSSLSDSSKSATLPERSEKPVVVPPTSTKTGTSTSSDTAETTKTQSLPKSESKPHTSKPAAPPPLPKKPKPVSVVAPLSSAQQQIAPGAPTAVEEDVQPLIPSRDTMASRRVGAAKKAESIESKKSPGVKALIASMEVKVKSETPPVPPPKPAKKKPATQEPRPAGKSETAPEPKPSVSGEDFHRTSAQAYNAARTVSATTGKQSVESSSSKKQPALQTQSSVSEMKPGEPPSALSIKYKSAPPPLPISTEEQGIPSSAALTDKSTVPSSGQANGRRAVPPPPPPVTAPNEQQRPTKSTSENKREPPLPPALSCEQKLLSSPPAPSMPSTAPKSIPAAQSVFGSTPKPFSLSSSASTSRGQPKQELNKQVGLSPSFSSQFGASTRSTGPADTTEKAKSDDSLAHIMGAAKKQHAEDVVRELISMDTTIDNVEDDLGSVDKTLNKMTSTNQLILSNPDLAQKFDTDVNIGDVQVQTDDLNSTSMSVQAYAATGAKQPVKDSRIDSDDESESLSESSSDESSSYSTSYDSDDSEPVMDHPNKANKKPTENLASTASMSQKPAQLPVKQKSDPIACVAASREEPLAQILTASPKQKAVAQEKICPKPEEMASAQQLSAPRAKRSFLSKKSTRKTKSESATSKEQSRSASPAAPGPSFNVDEQQVLESRTVHSKPAVHQSDTASKPVASRLSLTEQFNRINEENLSVDHTVPEEKKTPSKMTLRDKIKTFEATGQTVESDTALTGTSSFRQKTCRHQQAPIATEKAETVQYGKTPLPSNQSQQTTVSPTEEYAMSDDSSSMSSSSDEFDDEKELTKAVMPEVPTRQGSYQPASSQLSAPPKPKPRGSLENLADDDSDRQQYANTIAPPTAPRTSSSKQHHEEPRYQNLPVTTATTSVPSSAEPTADSGLHYATSEVALNLIGLEEHEANRASRVYEHHAEAMDRELQRRSQEVSQATIDAEFAKINQAVKRLSQESPVLPPKSPFATLTSNRLTSQSSLEGGSFRYAEPGNQEWHQPQQNQPHYRKHETLESSTGAEAALFTRAKRASKSLGPKERRQKKTKSAELTDQRYKGVDLETPPAPQKKQKQATGKKFASSNDLLSSESVSSSNESDDGQERRHRPRQPPPPLPPHGGRHSQHETSSHFQPQQQQSDEHQYYNLPGHHIRARSMDVLEEPTLPVTDDKKFSRGPASVASSMLSVNVANKDSDELAQLLERYLHQKREEKIHRMLVVLQAQDPAKYRQLMARFKEEIGMSGVAIGPTVYASQPALRPAGSTSTLLNNLDPGITNVLLGPEGTLRDTGTLQTMLHPSEPQRTILWDPNLPETPPPAMRPPPKPMPPGLSKTVPPDGWKAVDDHVMELLDIDYNTFTEQVNNLCGRYQSDVEKCRAIFRFLTARFGQPLIYDPQAPLTTLIGCLRGVQAGEVSPHELFKRMCAYAGIHCEILHGYSKGAGYRPGMNLKDNRMFRNTWTAVYVEGCWRFVNVAWGGRRLSRRQGGATEVRLKCDNFYFLTEPEEHIYEHCPDDRRWQLLRSPITLSHFMRLPLLKSPFFNAGMRLKKGKYDDTLMTQSGRVSLKIGVTKFVGVTCQLQNRSDMTTLRGKTLARLIGEVLHVLASPAQPGTYFLNIFVSPDWTSNEHELAASFQVKCAENNFDRLALGRYPEVGFLGSTPAAQKLGVSFLTSHGSKAPLDPYVVHSAKELLKLPVVFAPGLKIAHQMKCYQRTGQSTEQCDSYALLQCRKQQQAEYWIACPADGYYFFTVYASEAAAAGAAEDEELDCVYRLLIDCRRGLGKYPAFPMQSSLFNGCYLHEPMQQHLDVGRRYNFRLEARHCRAVAVVLNGKTWLDLDRGRSGVWSKKLSVGEELGELSIYSQMETDEEGKFNKLLDYDIVQRMTNLQKS